MQNVGRYVTHLALQFRRRTLIERRQQNACRQACPHLVDVLRIDPSLYDKLIVCRYQFEQGCTRRNHSANRVYATAHDDTVHRCTNLRLAEHMLGGIQAFTQIENFRLNLFEFIDDTLTEALPDLENFEFLAGDLGLVSADRRQT